jgi:hypothetical protein
MSGHAELKFVKAELKAGLTFSLIALQSKSQAKIARNRADARKAYDTLVRFSDKSPLSIEGVEEFANLLAKLKSNLLQLSENL